MLCVNFASTRIAASQGSLIWTGMDHDRTLISRRVVGSVMYHWGDLRSNYVIFVGVVIAVAVAPIEEKLLGMRGYAQIASR